MRTRFALIAAVFEAGMTVLAIVLGWILGIPPLRTFRFDVPGAAIGIAATLPLLALFWLCLRLPWQPLREIARILDDTLVPLFRDCRLDQLAIISLLAGLGEETLFRGIVQAGLADMIGGRLGVWLGLVIASCVFGLLHHVTLAYAVLAGLVGFYLGAVWLISGNLLAPILAHAIYDFVALAYLVKVRRREPPKE